MANKHFDNDVWNSTGGNPDQPGHFRIGSVVLAIPPTHIQTNKVTNDDQVSTLRTSTSMFVKSGQSRWDVTVRWKAIRNGPDIAQWEQLRTIVAMFRAAPFVEVENDYLRQIFTNVQIGYKTQRMAFALRQIRIDTGQTADAIDVTLTMTLFNFAPFTTDFGYVGTDGESVDAGNSTTFTSFLNSWIAKNMDIAPGVNKSTPTLQSWYNQEEGVTTFKWRRYKSVAFMPNPADPANASSAGYSTPSAPTSLMGAKMKPLPPAVQSLILQTAQKYGLDPNIVAALCYYESGGDINAGRGRTDKGGYGLMQLVASTAQGLGVSNVFDPAQNVDGGCRYLQQQLKSFGNYPQALAAYNTGAGVVKSYRDGTIKPYNPRGLKTADGIPPSGVPNPRENAPRYVHTILTNAGKADLLPKAVPLSTNGQPPATPNDTINLGEVDQSYVKLVNDAFNTLPKGNWFLDHYTNYGVFFYQDEEVILPNAESVLENELGLYPDQLSLVMVNNLPQIPLAGFQYPTYQHVGPCDTMLSISMMSVGGDSEVVGEPEHFGIEAVTGMAATLETQYHELRNTWRAVSSVHRMQAVFIENQVFNMLGIYGVLLRGINTESIPDSANHMQVSMLMSQYENIFEETSPFRMNGVAKAYKGVISNMLTSGALDKVSTEEQQAYFSVKEFGDNWKSHNESYLLTTILNMAKGGINPLAIIDTPPTGIWNSDRDLLLNVITTSLDPVLPVTPGLQYPGLAKRYEQLMGKTQEMEYSDYFVFSQIPNKTDPARVSAIRTLIEAKFASQKSDILESMYQSVYDLKLQTDPIFSRQLNAITTSPTFRDEFLSAANVNGPTSDPFNRTHVCYKDLGITDFRMGPADYFVDYSQTLSNSINDNLNAAVGTATDTASQVNDVKAANSEAFQFSDTGQQFPGGANALSRMKNIPAYSMAGAFPTYKLMLLEEDNTGVFYAFDNFYSYATVTDIEIVRYADKPDAAIIQITNLSHLLQHRFFDDTAEGKQERKDNRFNVEALGPNLSEPTTGGNPLSGIVASKTPDGQDYQVSPQKNMTSGPGDATTRAPLKFFALQTGSKIQVRLGYSNNPDLLFPAFTGQVTQIEGDEILTITCQGFMLELMTVPGTAVIANSHWGFNFATGGAAFGDLQWSNSGDTGSVMTKFIQAKTARHFGHWQINTQPDPMTKGFNWGPLAALAANTVGFTKIGALLQTGYDRSAENILINSIINFDGTVTAASRRLFDDEAPPLALGNTAYSVPQQSPLSVWEILKDVSRRLPQYNLLVKDYGFPYAADATLVFANPADWYYYRPPLFGEAEKELVNNITHGPLFNEWWDKIGRASFQEALDQAANDLSSHSLMSKLIIGNSRLSNVLSSLTDDAGKSPIAFTNILQQLQELASGTVPYDSSQSTIDRIAAFFADVGVKLSTDTFAAVSHGILQDISRNLQAVDRAWLRYLATADPAANTSRIKPVRKYHFIDHNSVIHNGISINDNMYNAVKMESTSGPNMYTVNQGIPEQHLRVLNIDSMMNDPKSNVYTDESIKTAYAQSFLREEVGKMYQGELIIRGTPEIEPMDVIILMDISTGTIGPIEVESVIHSFNLENGFITIVRPRLLVVVNESASTNIIRTLGLSLSNAWGELLGVKDALTAPAADVPGISGLNAARGSALLGGGLGAAAITAGIVWAPPAWVVVGALALLGGAGLLQWIDHTTRTQNLFKLMPLSRFGRPWLGGLQGFQISDFYYAANEGFTRFVAEEVSPTIESWHTLMNYQTDYLVNNQ